MYRRMLATIVAVITLGWGAIAGAQGAGSVSSADLQALRDQLNALTQRVDRLEQANSQLRTENAELRAMAGRHDVPAGSAVAPPAPPAPPAQSTVAPSASDGAASWASRIQWRGDFRYRGEYAQSERVVGSDASAYVDDAANRDRQRIRARFGFDAKVTEHVRATMLLATGGDDPRSANQTLGAAGTRKSIGLDMAYVDWQAGSGLDLVLGKQPWPFWRPGQSMFFDSDFNPEGLALRFDQGPVFGSAYGWWMSENYSADPAGENSDAVVAGAQLGLRWSSFGGETRVAAQYYDCSACKDHSPLYANNANGNTTYRVPGSTTNYLAYDYQVLEFSAETRLPLDGRPLQLWADYAQNLAPGVRYDQAYAAGVSYGAAAQAGDWNAAVWYQSVDKDALFGQFVESDFAGGNTDGDGWVLRGSYLPVKNVNLMATYFLNSLYKDVAPVVGDGFSVGRGLDRRVLQLDVNYRF